MVGWTSLTTNIGMTSLNKVRTCVSSLISCLLPYDFLPLLQFLLGSAGLVHRRDEIAYGRGTENVKITRVVG